MGPMGPMALGAQPNRKTQLIPGVPTAPEVLLILTALTAPASPEVLLVQAVPEVHGILSVQAVLGAPVVLRVLGVLRVPDHLRDLVCLAVRPLLAVPVVLPMDLAVLEGLWGQSVRNFPRALPNRWVRLDRSTRLDQRAPRDLVVPSAPYFRDSLCTPSYPAFLSYHALRSFRGRHRRRMDGLVETPFDTKLFFVLYK